MVKGSSWVIVSWILPPRVPSSWDGATQAAIKGSKSGAGAGPAQRSAAQSASRSNPSLSPACCQHVATSAPNSGSRQKAHEHQGPLPATVREFGCGQKLLQTRQKRSAMLLKGLLDGGIPERVFDRGEEERKVRAVEDSAPGAAVS